MAHQIVANRRVKVGRAVHTARHRRTSTTEPSSTTTEPSWTRVARRFGPGLITGASDDDPSGIAAYSQVGSQFGFGFLWTMAFSYPLMAGIQEICARIGLVTGRGLAGNLRRHAPKPALYGVIFALLAANTMNIGADIGAMAASLELIVGGSFFGYVIAFGLFSAVLQVFVPYRQYVPYLKWLCLSLFAYIGIAFVVRVPWLQIARSTLIPSLSWSRDSLMAVVAILGTTISPYLFFWQASEEVEEQRLAPSEIPLKFAPEQSEWQLTRMKADTWFGMAVSNVVGFFVILTAAVVFHGHGTTNIATTSQAAEALQPVAGSFARLLFAAGIIGTGLLALPVLAGSSAYAIGEAMTWPTGLEKTPHSAGRFYIVIAVSTLAGIGINLLHLDPIRLLFLTAVINGVASAPLMLVIMLLADKPDVMGDFVLPPRLRVLGWGATTIMSAAAVAFFATLGG